VKPLSLRTNCNEEALISPSVARYELAGREFKPDKTLDNFKPPGLHPRCLSGTFEQALTLRHLIRAEIGIAGLVAYPGRSSAHGARFLRWLPFRRIRGSS
jgi:hypothetical protein